MALLGCINSKSDDPHLHVYYVPGTARALWTCYCSYSIASWEAGAITATSCRPGSRNSDPPWLAWAHTGRREHNQGTTPAAGPWEPSSLLALFLITSPWPPSQIYSILQNNNNDNNNKNKEKWRWVPWLGHCPQAHNSARTPGHTGPGVT